MTYFFSAVLPIWFIDRAGRRIPLMIGAAGMSASFLLVAITVKLSQDGNTAAGWACLVFIISFLAFFGGSGWIANPWLYPAEICELRFRNIGSAMATMTDWIFNFMVVQITPIGAERLGWRFFLIFFVLNLAFIPTIYFFYPETAQKTLEELDFLFKDTTKGWRLTSKGSAYTDFESQAADLRMSAEVARDQNLDEKQQGEIHLEKLPENGEQVPASRGL